RAYMSIEEVVAVARAGAARGCREALFTLGDKPELRYRVAREELAALGCRTTLEYLGRAAEAVLGETGLLPHLNPGVLAVDDVRALRARPVGARAGASEPVVRRLSAAARRGHRRLGRRLSRDDRPRQPGSAVARPRTPADGDGESRAAARAAPSCVPGVDRRCVGR